jgi:hypothetical protein
VAALLEQTTEGISMPSRLLDERAGGPAGTRFAESSHWRSPRDVHSFLLALRRSGFRKRVALLTGGSRMDVAEAGTATHPQPLHRFMLAFHAAATALKGGADEF